MGGMPGQPILRMKIKSWEWVGEVWGWGQEGYTGREVQDGTLALPPLTWEGARSMNPLLGP